MSDVSEKRLLQPNGLELFNIYIQLCFLNFMVRRRRVCVPWGTNMAAGNQRKHLFLSFPTNA